ncbi:Acetylcholine receptor subunit alpha-like 2 [Tetrabaena socialis]|uniref:Acetylcholine receptor subunit alpha-like 2 n=1 Tax=Tetrabaena socialis TaxID=47790 RepID=A0A2J7ZP16_9CHLO|nr:Acetylcholine receptor subunit alpha-like 2 [Tetrabaena socialis]|eukprot:PNH02002.1 Acetylcholine receptor subunit alpha-like 2 [Tetrabaena socialis]
MAHFCFMLAIVLLETIPWSSARSVGSVSLSGARRGAEGDRPGGVPSFPTGLPIEFTASHSTFNQPRRRLKSNGPGADNSTADGEGENINGPASDLLAALMDGYDKTAFPPVAGGGPVEVEINVAMHKIISINLQEGSMDLNVWFRLHWKDPRLTWNATDWGVNKLYVLNPELRYTDVWYPDVTLWNSAYDVSTTLGAQALILNPSGDVFWGRNGLIAVSCNFKGLAAFPFGAVTCLLEFGTWSHGPLSVVVKQAPQGGATIAGNSITDMRGAKAVEWKFHNVKSWVHLYPAYPCCPDESNWPVVLVDIELRRTQTLFALKILVPQPALQNPAAAAEDGARLASSQLPLPPSPLREPPAPLPRAQSARLYQRRANSMERTGDPAATAHNGVDGEPAANGALGAGAAFSSARMSWTSRVPSRLRRESGNARPAPALRGGGGAGGAKRVLRAVAAAPLSLSQAAGGESGPSFTMQHPEQLARCHSQVHRLHRSATTGGAEAAEAAAAAPLLAALPAEHASLPYDMSSHGAAAVTAAAPEFVEAAATAAAAAAVVAAAAVAEAASPPAAARAPAHGAGTPLSARLLFGLARGSRSRSQGGGGGGQGVGSGQGVRASSWQRAGWQQQQSASGAGMARAAAPARTVTGTDDSGLPSPFTHADSGLSDAPGARGGYGTRPAPAAPAGGVYGSLLYGALSRDGDGDTTMGDEPLEGCFPGDEQAVGWKGRGSDDEPDPEPEPVLTLDAVLHVGTPELLETYLQLILESASTDMTVIRERVANAMEVFGMEDLVLRLFPIVGRPETATAAADGAGPAPRAASGWHGAPRRGVTRGGRRMGASCAIQMHQVGAKAGFHTMIGDEYNAKWRLLSAFIDANSRYLMPVLYCIGFLLIIWGKVWDNKELNDGPSPERSALGLQR